MITAADIRRRIGALTPTLPSNERVARRAAVLVALEERSEDGGIDLVLTQRSHNLSSHPGEVCFPGGKIDPSDADEESAALREAHEEIGLDPRHCEVVGRLPQVLSKHLLLVTPVVAFVRPEELAPNEAEVACIFRAPLEFFQRAESHSGSTFSWLGQELIYHKFFFDAGDEAGEQTIMGLTAAMIVELLEVVEAHLEFPTQVPGQRSWADLAQIFNDDMKTKL